MNSILVMGTLLVTTSVMASTGPGRAIDRLQCVNNANSAVRNYLQSDKMDPQNPDDYDLSVEAGGYNENVKSDNLLTILAVGSQMEGYDYYTVAVDLSSDRCPVISIVLSESDL